MPGKNYYDSITNYWRVYSGVNKKSKIICREFLETFINTKTFPLTELNTTIESETAKVLENTYRAVNIALMDEWTKFSYKYTINLKSILNAIKMRPTHSNIMSPGIGVGGYCLTKDPYFAYLSQKHIFKSKNILDFKFSKLAMDVNKEMTIFPFQIILDQFKNNIYNKKFLVLGIAYKNDVGDSRNSPSIDIIKKLISHGAEIDYYDPYIPYCDEINIFSIKDHLKIDKYKNIIFAVNHSPFKKINLMNFNFKKNTKIFDFIDKTNKKELDFLQKNKISIIRLS